MQITQDEIVLRLPDNTESQGFKIIADKNKVSDKYIPYNGHTINYYVNFVYIDKSLKVLLTDPLGVGGIKGVL